MVVKYRLSSLSLLFGHEPSDSGDVYAVFGVAAYRRYSHRMDYTNKIIYGRCKRMKEEKRMKKKDDKRGM